jgi:hypothetical protein
MRDLRQLYGRQEVVAVGMREGMAAWRPGGGGGKLRRRGGEGAAARRRGGMEARGRRRGGKAAWGFEDGWMTIRGWGLWW